MAGKMKAFIFAGEHPANFQHVASVIDSLNDDDHDEYVLCLGREVPEHRSFEYSNGILGLIEKIGAKVGFVRNRFHWDNFELRWRTKKSRKDWSKRCGPLKSNLPWVPDIAIVVTPNQGHTKDHIVPWCRRKGVPVLSIDHGMPTVRWPWLGYRKSMMGCLANATWSEVCSSINVQIGAPEDFQIITGSPSIDGLLQDSMPSLKNRLGISRESKIILLLGTHRRELKNANDEIFKRVIEKYGQNQEYSIVYKPHPVEISKNDILDVPESVITTTEQEYFIPLVRHSHTIVSMATSVIVPALALYRPFVNTIPSSIDCISEDEAKKLEDRLCGAAFPISMIDKVISGEVRVDRNACDRAFGKFGYKKDGRNGERVVSLSKWIVMGRTPSEWKDTVA